MQAIFEWAADYRPPEPVTSPIPDYPGFEGEFEACLAVYREQSPNGHRIQADIFRRLVNTSWQRKISLAARYVPGSCDRRIWIPGQLPSPAQVVRWGAVQRYRQFTWEPAFLAAGYRDWDIGSNKVTDPHGRVTKFSKAFVKLTDAGRVNQVFGETPEFLMARMYDDIRRAMQDVVISFNPLDILIPSDCTTGWTSCWALDATSQNSDPQYRQGNGGMSFALDGHSGILLALRPDDRDYPYTKLGRRFVWGYGDAEDPEGWWILSENGAFPDALVNSVIRERGWTCERWASPSINHAAHYPYLSSGPWHGPQGQDAPYEEINLKPAWCLVCGREIGDLYKGRAAACLTAYQVCRDHLGPSQVWPPTLDDEDDEDDEDY